MQRLVRAWSLTLLGLLVAAALVACSPATGSLQITHIRPTTAEPGGLVLVSGHGFNRDDVVWLNGQPAGQVTWVNEGLLTAVVPDGLTAGAYPLEVRPRDGQRAAVSLTVGGRPAAPPLVPPRAQVPPSPTSTSAPSTPAAAGPSLPPATVVDAPRVPTPPPVAAPSRPPPAPVTVSTETAEGRKKAEERLREEQKREAERLREQQKREDERRREEEKKRREDEKKRQEQQGR